MPIRSPMGDVSTVVRSSIESLASSLLARERHHVVAGDGVAGRLDGRRHGRRLHRAAIDSIVSVSNVTVQSRGGVAASVDGLERRAAGVGDDQVDRGRAADGDARVQALVLVSTSSSRSCR